MNRTLLSITAIAALATALAVSPASAGTNFLTNGSFETGSFSSWTLAAGVVSSANTKVANALDFVYPSIGGGYVPEQGDDFAMLGDDVTAGAVPGATLSQTITTAAGQGLLLTYYVASDGYTGNSFSVQWNGTTIAGSQITNLTDTSYTEYQFWVKTVGTSDTLKFLAEDNDGFILLDNVSLEVPEPASMALLGMGLLAGAGAYRRRRAAKKA